MAIQHYQVIEDGIADGVGSWPSASLRWLKMGVALGCSFCLVLLSIVASSTSTPAQSQSAESTSLVGLSPSLRSRSGGIVKSGLHIMQPGVAMAPLRVFGMGSTSPLEKIAITAIKAARVNAAQVELDEELSNTDDDIKAKMSKLEEAVVTKARDMTGVTAPLGFFDPLGFSTKAPPTLLSFLIPTNAPEGRLLFFREVEVKHGRVAMLASLGILVAERFHPLFGGNINVPSYIAFQETPLQTFWPAVLAAIAIPESQQIKTFNSPSGQPVEEKVWSIRSDHVAGDLGFDPLGL